MEDFGETRSVCPICLQGIEARYVARGDAVFLEKACPDHGAVSTRVWQGRESWTQWVRPKIPIRDRFHMTPALEGCPFDCGLCPDHGQQTCTAVLEITRRCNLSCRFCFASALPGAGSRKARETARPDPTDPDQDPDLETLTGLMEKVWKVSPGCSLQLSGGEPTLREDLPRIVAAARKTGFPFVQLNTNGLALGQDPDLAPRLREAGLSSVFLQFDGVSDSVYETLRGRPMARLKEKAVEACGKSGIGVVLVPTLVPEINDHEIGAILTFALARHPVVRGVHFQPVSYFGRHPLVRNDTGNLQSPGPRMTLPEVLSAIQDQGGGRFHREDFKPASCEHALCSFSGKYLVGAGNQPTPLTLFPGTCCPPAPAELGAGKARASVQRHWRGPGQDPGKDRLKKTFRVWPDPDGSLALEAADGLDRFLKQAEAGIFTVSGMAFQDAWALDTDRLRGCCIHAVAPDGRLIPFCAYNLTGADGQPLYREN